MKVNYEKFVKKSKLMNGSDTNLQIQEFMLQCEPDHNSHWDDYDNPILAELN